jgi:hypothetical protein
MSGEKFPRGNLGPGATDARDQNGNGGAAGSFGGQDFLKRRGLLPHGKANQGAERRR